MVSSALKAIKINAAITVTGKPKSTGVHYTGTREREVNKCNSKCPANILQ
jgi:hypothetical protein